MECLPPRGLTPAGARFGAHSQPPPGRHRHGCDGLSAGKTHAGVTSAAIGLLRRGGERHGAWLLPPTGRTAGRSDSQDLVIGIGPRARPGNNRDRPILVSLATHPILVG